MSAGTVERLPPLFIVLNAGSGHGDKAAIRATIEGVLTEAGRAYEMIVVEDPRELAAIARRTVETARAAGGVVVAAGGDGTLNTVAQATLGSGCAFGVLPQGTFNYFGRRHGILHDGHRSKPEGLFCPVGMHPGKHQHHGDHGVLPPDIGQQFQSFGVARIDTGKDEIDRVPLHQPNRQSVGGCFLDKVAE